MYWCGAYIQQGVLSLASDHWKYNGPCEMSTERICLTCKTSLQYEITIIVSERHICNLKSLADFEYGVVLICTSLYTLPTSVFNKSQPTLQSDWYVSNISRNNGMCCMTCLLVFTKFVSVKYHINLNNSISYMLGRDEWYYFIKFYGTNTQKLHPRCIYKDICLDTIPLLCCTAYMTDSLAFNSPFLFPVFVPSFVGDGEQISKKALVSRAS